ncbi:hypothetical protein BJ912DRAFT_931871 [Pholiota molesta]|nr:hypothetical protein BJ912DRAFT_931871 [Pholiota molesta]
MSTLNVPVDIETSAISSGLNSVILLIFLMDTKNASKQHLVSAAITMLYLSSIFGTSVQWYDTKWQFVDNGDSRDLVFLAFFEGPGWDLVALNTTNCITFAIADGLLIWRCFHAWNRSLRIISMPLLLIVTEIALFLVEISFNAKYTNLIIPPALAARINAVLSAAFFMSFATTFVMTILIAYRIYSVSKHKGASTR